MDGHRMREGLFLTEARKSVVFHCYPFTVPEILSVEFLFVLQTVFVFRVKVLGRVEQLLHREFTSANQSFFFPQHFLVVDEHLNVEYHKQNQ